MGVRCDDELFLDSGPLFFFARSGENRESDGRGHGEMARARSARSRPRPEREGRLRSGKAAGMS
jgi:hypothetical protein